MGPTGSGKTTFMNCLSNRINYKSMEVRGSVTCNGKELSVLPYRHMISYCQQLDVLIPNLSTYEILHYRARLTLSKSPEEIDQLVKKIIKRFGLEGCAQTWAGSDEIRGLSGGERKRTSVALEVVKDPIILFLDEPTTGLDSTAALNVVKICKEFAEDEGKIVIANIHQPDYETFSQFQQLMLIADGRCIYRGQAQQCENYFNSLGYFIPEHIDAAEYFLALISVEALDSDKSHEEHKEDYIEKIYQLEKAFKDKQEQEDLTLEPGLPDLSQEAWFKMYENRVGKRESQTKVLIERNTKNTLRDKATFLGLIARSIFPALGFTYAYARFSSQTESLYDRNGAMCLMSMIVGYASAAFLVNYVFFQEKANVIREAGMYSS